MATARTWRTHHQAEGPQPARLEDIGGLNQVFSDAFSERYRRDGMVGVRVPFLNPAIWRYAIEDANGGALVRGGVEWLRKARAGTVGLETMPRTMDNIGFYSALGFVPGRLTITLTLDAAAAPLAASLYGRLREVEKRAAREAC